MTLPVTWMMPSPIGDRRHSMILRCLAFVTAWCCLISRAESQAPPSGGDVSLNVAVPREVQDVSVEQKTGSKIPADLVLVNADGRKLRSGDLFDGEKPAIVTLNYSNCPMLCNVQLNALTKSLTDLDLQIGEDFRLLSVSIDPNDTTADIRRLKSRYISQLENQPDAEASWSFCSADEPTIERIADALGFRYTYDQASGEYYHPAMLAFLTPEGVITRYSLGVDFPAEQLRLALLDAGEGKVGGPIDQFVLWCYSYDPNKNSYVPQAWKLMRLGGATTVGLMLVVLTPYWIGRKRGQSRDLDRRVRCDGDDTSDRHALATEN